MNLRNLKNDVLDRGADILYTNTQSVFAHSYSCSKKEAWLLGKPGCRDADMKEATLSISSQRMTPCESRSQGVLLFLHGGNMFLAKRCPLCQKLFFIFRITIQFLGRAVDAGNLGRAGGKCFFHEIILLGAHFVLCGKRSD